MHLTHLAREYGDKPAVIMAGSGAVLSYAELDRQSNKIAQLFRSRGLRPGDHIAVLMANRVLPVADRALQGARSVSFEDELPRLPSGKMLRRLLMDRYRGVQTGLRTL